MLNQIEKRMPDSDSAGPVYLKSELKKKRKKNQGLKSPYGGNWVGGFL